MSKRVACSVCSQPFEAVRPWHRFCSSRCRSISYRGGVATPCTYCGQPSNTVDHVPPRVSRQAIIDQGLEGKYPFHEVPCCYECNHALGARFLWTVAQRKRWIKKWLRKKYKKYLSAPHWSDEEIAELGPGMRRLVLAGLSTAEHARQRILY